MTADDIQRIADLAELQRAPDDRPEGESFIAAAKLVGTP